jgi:Uma2 family endonuclease
MATKAALTVEEYLHTSFPNLDKEYRDGEIVERSLPDKLHSKTQLLVLVFFHALRNRLPVFPFPELRLKLRSGLYRIPDVSVFHPVEPPLNVPDTPPLIAVEILSEGDRATMVLQKLKEYRDWGVQHVWLIDPHARHLFTWDNALTEVNELTVPTLGLTLTQADLFEPTPTTS